MQEYTQFQQYLLLEHYSWKYGGRISKKYIS